MLLPFVAAAAIACAPLPAVAQPRADRPHYDLKVHVASSFRLVTGDRRPPLVFDDPFVTLDDGRAARALDLLKTIASDFQVIYLTCSPRYDGAADAVVVLDGPTVVDAPEPTPATAGVPA